MDMTAWKERSPEKGRPVTTIPPAPLRKKKLRVAGYCRVSTDMETQVSSIENQRTHYQKEILQNPDWELADLYWETGVSGTRTERRPELERLMADCRAGKVDMVITKSISRFSRNTADCLEMVRSLQAMGVVLWFQKENIRTDSMESELMLSLLSAFAQDESRSLSANVKWGIRKRFRDGTYRAAAAPYGYRKENGSYAVCPEEAEVVRGVFRAVAEGKGTWVIARELNAGGIPTWSAANGREARDWSPNTVRKLVHNEFYVGDRIFQKTFRDEDYRQRRNTGQLDRFILEDAHPAIVDRETFHRANDMIRQRSEAGGGEAAIRRRRNRYCFSGKLICGECGKPMYREAGRNRPKYLCQGHVHGSCGMGGAPEAELQNAFATLLNKLAFGEKRLGMLLGREGASELRAAILRRGLCREFGDEELFRRFVRKAVVWSQSHMEVQFECGISLREELGAAAAPGAGEAGGGPVCTKFELLPAAEASDPGGGEAAALQYGRIRAVT